MALAAAAADQGRPATRWLDRAGVALTLILPLFLLHGRAPADITIVLIDLLFLVRSAMVRDWAWLRVSWVRIALIWWAWLVVCSLPPADVLQALGVVRFPLLPAALAYWVLREQAIRGWVARLLRWSLIYITIQCLCQFAFGRNLFGWPKGGDGELTGPYTKPRAGPVLSRILFPPLLVWSTTRGRALALMIGSVLLMMLVAQRMPLLLTFLGLFLTALLTPKLRPMVLWTAVAAGLLLAALPVVSPSASHRVIGEFSRQMSNFSSNHYGLIAARSVAIVRQHPVFGAGFDGFRRLCDDPAYFQGWHGDDGGGAGMCVQHPHNFYLQALVEGGVPGLVLFAGLAIAWLVAIGRGIGGANPSKNGALRTGLFIAAAIHLWPIAGNTDWVAMPLAGYFFLQLGLALAETYPASSNSMPS